MVIFVVNIETGETVAVHVKGYVDDIKRAYWSVTRVSVDRLMIVYKGEELMGFVDDGEVVYVLISCIG